MRCEILRSDGDNAGGKYVIVCPRGEDISKKGLRSEDVLCEGRKRKTFRIEVGSGMISGNCAGLNLRVHGTSETRSEDGRECDDLRDEPN